MILGRNSYPYEYLEILELSTIESEEDLDSLDLPHLIAVGYMLRCNRLLRSVATLVENDFYDVVGVVVRPVIENVITAFWLLEDPEINLPVLLGNHRLIAQRMRNWYPTRENRSIAKDIDSFMRSTVGHCKSANLPRMEDRAGAFWKQIEPVLAYLSSEIHGSINSVWKHFFQMDGGVIVIDGSEEDLPEKALANAAYLLLTLARRLCGDIGWGTSDIDELLAMIESWQPADVTA